MTPSDPSPVEEELLSRCRGLLIEISGEDDWLALTDEQREMFTFAFLIGIRVTENWVSERMFGPLVF